MSLENSPALDEYKDGLPEKLPPSRGPRKTARSIIAILVILTLVLAAANFVQSSSDLAVFIRKGTITGYVVDEATQPLIVDVYVLGTDIETRTDASGYFEIQGVPVGKQSIAVATDVTGDEFEVEVVAGSIVGMGEIQLITSDPDEE